jgi:hypothetical protein
MKKNLNEILELTNECLIDENIDIILKKYNVDSDKYNFELLLESTGDEFAICNQIVRFYLHIAKCKCQPNRISSSWINTIDDSIKQLNKLVNTKNKRKYLNYVIDKKSKEGIKDAIKEIDKSEKRKDYEAINKLKKFSFPKEIISYDFIMSTDKIIEYILKDMDNQYIN